MALSSFAPPSHTEEGEYVFSVGELNRTVRDFLEQHFSTIWVCGEISNLSCPVSGNLYFTLKDEQGQIRCAFFRNRHIRAMPALKNGQRVLVNAKLSVYPERGDYQLIIESLQDAGEGLLQQQFEALKKKLLAEGLFDPARKRPLPKFIQTLGVITSSTGAALQDVLSVLKRRFALVKVIVYCAQVQGAEA
ncbi:MAG: exodeoxyribonuclease VII large subunit, partial [Gammaproteobacteria bacterium]|nr:exodeoxyribonuclease VII large subunit [Gammaproteobacteria bacterium]